jgi:uncharacterized protein YlxP (DUF503 family)
MVIGVLQFEVFVHDATSIKDKRRVVSSLKDRLHREHLCAVAEVGDPDMLNHALLAAVVVGREGRRIGEVLDAISAKLRALPDGEVGDVRRELIHGLPDRGDEADAPGEAHGAGAVDERAAGDADLAREMLARFEQPEGEGGPGRSAGDADAGQRGAPRGGPRGNNRP